MSEQVFVLTVTATGEVRDANGNLISAEPVTGTVEVTASQLAEMLGGTGTLEGDQS